jgi:ElaB/YqjD/DUF883 family membrane-anchored ribosome-binding protein
MAIHSTETLTKRSIGRLRDAADGIAGDVRSAAKGRFNKASGAAHDAYDRASGRAREVSGEVRSFLEEHSLLAVGIGVAVGALVSLAMRGKSAAKTADGAETQH